MKRRVTLISTILFFTLYSLVFSNGLSLNSVGTRALGMGGAFVGLANDGTALYWNPAGLAGQKSGINLFATDIIPSATYKLAAAGIDAKTKTNHYIGPNLFANYSMDKWAFALGVYIPAGLGAEWDPAELNPMLNGLEMLSKIAVINISPGVAYQVTDQFSVGLAVNIYYAMFDMKQPTPDADFSPLGGPHLMPEQFEEESTGMGFGATLGLKYQATEQLSLGATVRLATKVSMEGTAKNPLFTKLPAIAPIPGMFPGSMPGPGESDFSRDVTWPMWIAGGIAYKATDCLTLVMDVQYSQWSELDVLVAEYDDAYWAAAMASEGNDEFILNWEDKMQIRAGAEYAFNESFTGRLGYYYDPAPAPDETLNILFPSSTNNVITAGATVKLDKLSLNAAFEYLMGGERDAVQSNHNMPGIHQMDIVAASIGIAYEL